MISFFAIRIFAGVFVWITIILFLLSIFALAVFTMQESKRLSVIAKEENFESTENNTYFDATNLYRISIVTYIVGALVTLIILFNLGTIALSIAVIKSAS